MPLNKNISPYYDDFDASKGYHQILFIPARAVQARELSQIQSQLQEQHRRLGNHLFKDGSVVIPGDVLADTQYAYVKLKDEYNGTEIDVDVFENKRITGLASGAVARVLQTVPQVGSDPNTLYVQYETGNSSVAFTGDISSGSNIVTNVSSAGQGKLTVGAKITGTGIPSNCYITEIISTTSVRLNSGATSTSAGTALTMTTSATFNDDEVIATVSSSISDPVYNAETIDDESTGYGSKAQIRTGVYYIDGYYVMVADQTIILDKYDNKPSYRVGLEIIESFVTEAQDPSLNDPARGSTNFNAMGAHRYHIELVLSKRTIDATNDENFVELFRIKDGVIQVNRSNIPEYNEIAKTLARRTYDESGDYTVRHFPIDIREHLDDGTNRGIYSASEGGDETKLAIGIEPGKAYVRGYEIENIATMFIDLNKARDTARANNFPIPVSFGSYVDVVNLEGTFDVTSYGSVNLYGVDKSDITYPGSSIGTAKVRAMQFISGTPGDAAAVYRLWLFDIQMTGGNVFSDNVKALAGGGSPAPSADIKLEGGKAILRGTSQNISVFKNPQNFIQTYKDSGVSDTSYSVQRKFSGTMSGNSLTLSAGSDEVFMPFTASRFHVSVKSASGTAVGNGFSNGDVINLNAGGNSVVLGGSPTGAQVTITIPSIAGSQIDVIATIRKTGAVEKTKSLTSNTENGLTPSAGVVQLSKADVYRVVKVQDVANSNADITSRFTLDTGQRDNYYDRGRLILKPGATAPSGNVNVEYEYFTHGSGDFFSVDSYDGVLDYADIPSYTSRVTGEVYNLRDCIDFRPRVNDAGNGFSSLTEFVAPSEDMFADFNYYLPRVDKLFLGSDGVFKVIEGTSNLNPLPPNPPENGMVLYEIQVPPYTLKPSDVAFRMIDNRRYTMRDIGKLEKRIANVEFYVALSLLEKETADLFIDDGTGANRFKNGFIVDNFKSQLVADGESVNYKASIDPSQGIMRPPFYVDNVPLELFEGSSSNIQVTGPLVTLPYTTEVFIEQPRASRIENINPYNVIVWSGFVTLDPSSDEWFETERLPDNVTLQEGNFNQVLAENQNILNGVQWNSWQTDWVGRSVSTTSSSGNRRTTTTSRQVGEVRTGVKTDIVEDIAYEIVGDRVVNITAIPYIRSRTVSFSARALKPNTRVYPFFDNVAVSSYVTPTGGTLGGELVTDRLGNVSGTFSIPNTDTVRFRTGTRVFRLSDSPTNDRQNPGTYGEANYTASGVLETRQTDVVGTRNAKLMTSSVEDSRVRDQIISISQQTINTRPPVTGGGADRAGNGGGRDPLAQSFFVTEDGGCFVSKVDVYFQSKDENVPVTLMLVTMNNGYPTQTILPFGEVTLAPSQVNISDDASAVTSFVFEAPVYLQKNAEYAFVLLANTDNYHVWISHMGDLDVDGRRISEQPSLGSIFKSQNASTWTAVQEEDIKFRIHKCVFNTGVVGQAVAKNVVLGTFELPEDPFFTTNSSSVVTVHFPNHGFRENDEVTISGVSSAVNDIPSSEFNDTHTVSNVTLDTFDITLSSNANLTGSAGGTGNMSTFNFQVDLLNLITEELVFSDTGIVWGIRTTAANDALDTSYSSIVPRENFQFNNPVYILSADNQPSSERTLLARASLASANPNVSPVIDLDRLSVITVSNRINNDSTDETKPDSGDALAKYITKRITLEESATGMRVYFASRRPADSSLKVYVKTKPDGIDDPFDDFDWEEMTPVSEPGVNDVDFRDYIYELNDLAPFSVFAVKIVMLSSNTSKVPEIRDFRAIALGT